MAELTTVARPYATAVYEYAVAHQTVAAWAAVLNGLAIIAKDKRVQRYLSDPKIEAEQAGKFFLAIGKELLTDKIAQNFVAILAENKRLLVLPQIAKLFVEFRARDEALLDVEVFAAEPLSDAYKNKIIAGLEKRFNKDIKLHCHTDSSLLAGAVIRIKDFVIDGSVKGKLQRLKTELI